MMRTYKIVVLDGHTLNPGDLSWAPFEKYGQVTVYDHTQPGQVARRAEDADVLVVNKVVINRLVLEQLPGLRAICVTATGMNNIDLDAAEEFGIPVYNVAGYGTESVAQHVFSLILYFTNQVCAHSRSVRAGAWGLQPHFSYTLDTVPELSGMSIGIYGFGSIGKAVARIARAFGMQVLVHTPHPAAHPDADRFLPLESLCAESDFITLHARLTDENAGIVNSVFLDRMKPTAILINTGRGGLVNEQDLLTAVRNRKIAGAGLDVLAQEPPRADHPFFSEERIVVTPHMAWATKEARQRLMSASAGQIARLKHP